MPAKFLIPRKTAVKPTFQIVAFATTYEYLFEQPYTYPGEWHPTWEVLFSEDGEFNCVEESRVYRLKSGEMLFHAPNEFHTLHTVGNSPQHLRLITFYAEGELPSILKEGVFKLTGQECDEFIRLHTRIRRFVVEREPEEIGVLCLFELSAFFMRLALKSTANHYVSNSPSAIEYQQIITLMQRDIRKGITLPDIARQLGISVSYIKKVFMQYAGISPMAYYNNIRLNEAKRLLSQGLSVREVSDRLEFSSPTYFSAFFKQRVGIPPSRYIHSTEE